MSDTPRTDAELKRVADQLDGGEDNAAYVLSQFGAHACMLEREVEKLREVAGKALEALEDARRHNYALIHKDTDALVEALRAALKEPK